MNTPDLLERRPLATRQLRASHAAARWVTGLGVTPNAISVAGMFCGIAAGIALALTSSAPEHSRWLWFAGAALIQLRLLANMLDGMVALESGTSSRVGELFNEAPDRVSDAATLIGLGYAAASVPVLGYVAACVALFVAYVRAIGKAAGAHQEFCGPMAKPQRMFFATLAALWCCAMPAAWQQVGPLSVPALVLWLIIAGGTITAARRLVRISRALQAV
jgi:phosphatidylglycerophosphate synthase